MWMDGDPNKRTSLESTGWPQVTMTSENEDRIAISFLIDLKLIKLKIIFVFTA